MKIIRRSDQGGSTIMFVVVGVVLVLGLIGTFYILKLHGQQVRKEQAIATYDKQQADKKTKDTDRSKVVNTDDRGIPSTGSFESSSSSQELPVTGPSQTVNELIGIYLLTVAVVSYVLSRRELMRYL